MSTICRHDGLLTLLLSAGQTCNYILVDSPSPSPPPSMLHLLFTTDNIQFKPAYWSNIRPESFEQERERKLPVALGVGPCGQRDFGKVLVSAVDGTLLCRTAFEIRDEKEERLTFSRELRGKFFFFLW